MGYTHYWQSKSNDVRLNNNYGFAKKEIGDFLETVKSKNKNLLEIYYTYTEIHFNGIGDDSHEDFYLPAEFGNLRSFNFCKTARKPYDKIVLACLFILKKHLGNDLELSSDGYQKGSYCDNEVKASFRCYNNYQKSLAYDMSGMPLAWYFK